MNADEDFAATSAGPADGPDGIFLTSCNGVGTMRVMKVAKVSLGL
jgi:hypothetical protein